jgi:hypothetical protein
MRELANGKVKKLVFLDGRLMREDMDYVWKEKEPHFREVEVGRVDVVDFRKEVNVTTYTIHDPAKRSSDEGERLAARRVFSDYRALMEALGECPYEIVLADEPLSRMFGFLCPETGDTWLIRASDLTKTGPDLAVRDEFRQSIVKTHNLILKNK